MAVLLTALFPLHSSAADTGPDTQRQYLSGTDKDHTVTWEFFCDKGQNSGKWSTIPVPSNWELQGFGIYNYGNNVTRALRARAGTTKAGAKASAPDPQALPIQPTVTGKYRYRFDAPANWSAKRVFLVFDGSMTDTEAFINGKSAGPMHQGGFYKFRYDVTPLLKFGESNLLEATVSDMSANASVNNAERHADYWNYGGICRPVYLEAQPQEFIDRIAVDAQADGSLDAQVFLASGVTHADRVEAQLRTLDGNPVGQPFTARIASGASGVELKTKFNAVAQWSAESPNLYQIEVTLKQGNTAVHRMSKRIGFRTMEVRAGDGVYVNGRRILLKGCCRHTFWPDSGKTTSPEISLLDVNTIKDMNMNAVRMSHYPPEEHFLDTCDEMGLYVLDELGGWHGHYDTEIGHTLVQEMVTRDVNHPSILFWDNGNEGGWNTALDDDYAKWDPQHRHVLHPWSTFDSVNTKHYPDMATVEKLCAGPDIYMPTEMLHGLYDGGGGAQLKEYWQVMRQSKVSAGGFIWAYLDEAVKRTDQNGRLDSNGNDAPDGVVGPHREKEGSFYTIRQIWSPVQIESPDLQAPFAGVVTVQNEYGFTNLKDCKFEWEVRRFHSPTDADAGFDTIDHGSMAAPSIAPGNKGELKMKLPANWQQSDAISLKATDPHGREVWTWVWPIGDADNLRNKALAGLESSPKAPGTFSEEGDHYQLSSGPVSVFISKSTGMLTKVTRNEKTLPFANGPRPANEDEKSDQPRAASVDHLQNESAPSIEARYASGLKLIRWTMLPGGVLRLHYEYEPVAAKPFNGITFDCPQPSIKAKKWLGPGPYRVWGNRLDGGTLDVWQTPYNDSITGETWQYPEFKGYFRAVRWMTLDTTDGPITLVPRSDDLFVRVLTPKFGTTPMGTKVPFPAGDISFLHSIPSVGAKQRSAPKTPPLKGDLMEGTVDFVF